MDFDIINKDFIGVVEDNNGFLLFKKIPIEQDIILIKELEAMRDNPNKTVIDMQNHFAEYFPQDINSVERFSYIYPASYSDAYISNVCYPRFIKYDDYKKELEEYETNLRDTYLNSEADSNLLYLLKQSSEEEYQMEYNKRIDQINIKLEEKKESYKKHFKPERFIYAHNYTEKVKEVVRDENIKMISNEKIGWTDVTFPIDDNFSVYLKTNFGYGIASYFFCNINIQRN